MRPWERYWFNLHRHNMRQRKDRELNKIERAFFSLPARAYVRWHHLRHKFKNRRTSSEVLFNTTKEDA